MPGTKLVRHSFTGWPVVQTYSKRHQSGSIYVGRLWCSLTLSRAEPSCRSDSRTATWKRKSFGANAKVVSSSRCWDIQRYAGTFFFNSRQRHTGVFASSSPTSRHKPTNGTETSRPVFQGSSRRPSSRPAVRFNSFGKHLSKTIRFPN